MTNYSSITRFTVSFLQHDSHPTLHHRLNDSFASELPDPSQLFTSSDTFTANTLKSTPALKEAISTQIIEDLIVPYATRGANPAAHIRVLIARCMLLVEHVTGPIRLGSVHLREALGTAVVDGRTTIRLYIKPSWDLDTSKPLDTFNWRLFFVPAPSDRPLRMPRAPHHAQPAAPSSLHGFATTSTPLPIPPPTVDPSSLQLLPPVVNDENVAPPAVTPAAPTPAKLPNSQVPLPIIQDFQLGRP